MTQPPPEGRKITVDDPASPLDAGSAGPEGASAPAGPPAAPAHEEVSPEEVRSLVAQRDEYLDALQRLKAEFENYRKRAVRDRDGAALAARRDLASGLLPVMDNLERAVEALVPHGDEIVSGVEMVRGQLEAVLQEHGIEAIAAGAGEAFDPGMHEAVARQEVDHLPEGAITEVVQKGYRDAGGVVRPARVVVATTADEGG